MSTDTGWVPEACTLPTAEQPLRVAEFAGLFAEAVTAVHRDAPTRLRLEFDASARGEVEGLAEAESRCCSFFTFTFTDRTAERFTVTVDVPGSQTAVLDGLESTATGG